MTAQRLPTLFAIGLVAAVGVAALVDGLRSGDPDAEPASASTPAGTVPEGDLAPEAVALREAGATGTLLLQLADCRAELVELPDLARTPVDACGPLAQTGGVVTLDGRLLNPADNLHEAWCEGDGVAVARDGQVVQLPGCHPAWRPDGLLSLVHEGELWGVNPPDLRPRRLLSRADVRRAFTRANALGPNERRTLQVVDAVWLGQSRLFAVFRRALEPRYVVAAVERKRLVRWQCCFAEEAGLAASPGGGFVAVGTEGGAFAFRRNGRFMPVDARRPADAIAWSPGDRFLAVAGLGDVVVLELRGNGLAPLARLPIPALDLRWAASARDIVLPGGN